MYPWHASMPTTCSNPTPRRQVAARTIQHPQFDYRSAWAISTLYGCVLSLVGRRESLVSGITHQLLKEDVTRTCHMTSGMPQQPLRLLPINSHDTNDPSKVHRAPIMSYNSHWNHYITHHHLTTQHPFATHQAHRGFCYRTMTNCPQFRCGSSYGLSGGVIMFVVTSKGGFFDLHGGGQGRELMSSYHTKLCDIWHQTEVKTRNQGSEDLVVAFRG